jgi:hypothetical protein
MLFKKKALTSFFLILLLVSFFPLRCDGRLNIGETTEFLKYEVRDAFIANITHNIQLYNTGKRGVTRGELYVPLIRNVTARHLALITDISSSFGDPKILEDSYGNLYAWWNDIVIKPGETFTVEIQYCTLSFSVRFQIDSSLVKPYDTESMVYRLYTRPEEYVESNHPVIVSTAKTVIDGLDKTDYHSMVKEIYNFVVNHLNYQLQPEEKGALWALENKQGDCSEYSYLFVALCRAIGIPARIQAGFAFSNYEEETENGHMWAEYYLEGYGWIPVDGSWHFFDEIDAKHFSSLQTIPEYMSYANYKLNYTGNPPKDEHLVSISRTSITTMENFSLAKTLFQAILEIEEAEIALLLSKIIGAWLLFPYEYRRVEENFVDGELLLQNAIDSWSESLTTQAWKKIRGVVEAANNLIFNVMAVYVGGFLLLMIVIIVVILKRGRRFSEERIIENTGLS